MFCLFILGEGVVYSRSLLTRKFQFRILFCGQHSILNVLPPPTHLFQECPSAPGWFRQPPVPTTGHFLSYTQGCSGLYFTERQFDWQIGKVVALRESPSASAAQLNHQQPPFAWLLWRGMRNGCLLAIVLTEAGEGATRGVYKKINVSLWFERATYQITVQGSTSINSSIRSTLKYMYVNRTAQNKGFYYTESPELAKGSPHFSQHIVLFHVVYFPRAYFSL